MRALLEKFTVDQWRIIDAEYRKESLPSLVPAAVLLTVAIANITVRYMGRPSFIRDFEGAMALFETLPEPKLWPHVYWGLFKIVNYFLIPAVCIKWVLRRDLREFGLGLKHDRRVWLLYGGMLAMMVPIAYAVSFTDSFVNTYPKYKGAGSSWMVFLIWESVYGLQFFLLEYFYRGFILFALAPYIGSLAIFVMVVPYAMIHFGKPPAECVGSILAGIALGTIALRTRSIYGGVAVHCGVAWSMDVFALMQKGQLGKLFGSP